MDNEEARAEVMDMMAEATEAAAGLLPLDMVGAVADLVDPAEVAREMPWLTGELAKVALGHSDVSFGQGDQRFSDEAWRTVPYFRVLGQSYRLFELWMNRMHDSVDGSWQNKARARFAADVISAALSPTNYLGSNPAALRKAVETGGMSLVRGAQNMLKDMARGGMPAAADRKSFVVGENLACTPGAVVYRDEMFELLQYTPTTPRVRGIPLLMIPPQVNRHYILDLAPGRSVAEFAVSQGIQTFMIVWRNPSTLLGHGKWGLDDYIAAAERARALFCQEPSTRSMHPVHPQLEQPVGLAQDAEVGHGPPCLIGETLVALAERGRSSGRARPSPALRSARAFPWRPRRGPQGRRPHRPCPVAAGRPPPRLLPPSCP